MLQRTFYLEDGVLPHGDLEGFKKPFCLTFCIYDTIQCLLRNDSLGGYRNKLVFVWSLKSDFDITRFQLYNMKQVT